MEGVISRIQEDLVRLVNGWFLKKGKTVLLRQNAKEKNIAKDLTIGTGGHLISDVTANFLKDLVKKENYFI